VAFSRVKVRRARRFPSYPRIGDTRQEDTRQGSGFPSWLPTIGCM